jgi:DNA ligase-1
MNWIEFCRMNQAMEVMTPTGKINLIKKEWENITDKETFVKLLTLDLPPNNVQNKKAIKWLTKIYELFDDELDTEIYTYGDIGEAIYHFDQNDEDSSTGLVAAMGFLSLDCSKSDGTAYRTIREVLLNMSSLEKKWFLRFWLRKPRNGCGGGSGGVVRKMIAQVYGEKESVIKKYSQLHSLADIAICLERGEVPSNELKIGHYLKPMLAKVVPKEKWPKNRLLELKYDGARYQIHKSKDDLFIFNRKGLPVTDKFPDIAEEINSWDNLPSDFIIDTEIYPINSDGSPAPFKKMGTRIHSKDVEEAVERCPVKLAVFDCMRYDVENLVDLTLEKRLVYINKFPCGSVKYQGGEHDDTFYTKAINDGYEGMMIKDMDATYHSGKRSVAWAKYKPPRFELDVVITGARYGDGKRATVYGSYDIAVKDGPQYIQVGSIGTGFTDADLLNLTNQGRKIVSAVDNDTYKLLPRIVLEVTCDLVTQDAEGNYGLRFPRLLRIRDDKPVSDINTIGDLEAMI